MINEEIQKKIDGIMAKDYSDVTEEEKDFLDTYCIDGVRLMQNRSSRKTNGSNSSNMQRVDKSFFFMYGEF
jgi:hypothetical protein